jgi:hypothetical protein
MHGLSCTTVRHVWYAPQTQLSAGMGLKELLRLEEELLRLEELLMMSMK